ncbi:hypothetical protein LTR28_007638 [Elasticomyces elasticus]|nr:hypothetical protein LTR28_007638 [Elasticomyces elasticus]
MEAFTHPAYHTPVYRTATNKSNTTNTSTNSTLPPLIPAVSRASTAPHSKRSHLHHISTHRHQHHHSKHDQQDQSKRHRLAHSATHLRTPFDFPSTHQHVPTRTSGTANPTAPTLHLHPPRLIRPEDVAREQTNNHLRDDELRAALTSLSELAHAATRSLDDTYYALLEKASLLRATVAQLQSLCAGTRALQQDFSRDAAALGDGVAGQIRAFAGLEAQRRKVEELVARLGGSRVQARELGDRLERARERVEAWARREEEAAVRRKVRARIIWSVVAGVLVLLFAVLVGHRLRMKPERAFGHASERGSGSDRDAIGGWSSGRGKRSATISSESFPEAATASRAEADAVLNRIFDEL